MKYLLLLPLLASAPCHAANLAGLWLFDDSSNLAKATIGSDLTFAGTGPGTWSPTLADDASTSLTGVVTTPAAGPANRFIATHGIAANGGGAFVNQYTVVMDLFTPAGSRTSWRTLMQTNEANSNDGDYFIAPDNLLGVGAINYSATALDPARWTRLVLTFDLGTGILAYSNGSLFQTHASSPVDGRFSLDPTVLFFADNDGDNAPLNVGALAIYNGVLTGPEVAALGVAGAAIPEPSALLLGLAATGTLLGRRRRA